MLFGRNYKREIKELNKEIKQYLTTISQLNKSVLKYRELALKDRQQMQEIRTVITDMLTSIKKGKFEFFKSKGLWFFRLLASNGKIIAQSEAYNTKIACKKGIYSVSKFANTPRVVEVKK